MTVYDNAKKLISEVDKLGGNVLIIGASKTKSVEDMLEAKRGGIEIFAENKVQEFVEKCTILKEKYSDENIRWHFIGRLQRNKVKFVAGNVEIIHSVDSIRLLEAIDKKAKQLGIIQDVMIEINGDGEMSKGGIESCDIVDFLAEAKTFCNVNIVGIMPVLARGTKDQTYIEMVKLYNELRKEYSNIKYLSMGMSGDYEKAIKFGSNCVRVGSTLFGSRIYNEIQINDKGEDVL